MKRTLQLSTLMAVLLSLLLTAHPAAAQSSTGPCTGSAGQSASLDCARLQAYLQRQSQSWSNAYVPESTMPATAQRYIPNWDANDVAYIPESTMPATARRYVPNWDANDVAYIPESTMVVPLAELFGAEFAEVEAK